MAIPECIKEVKKTTENVFTAITDAEKKVFSPRKTVRAYCLQCTNENRQEVETCDADEQCVFYPYRAGKKKVSVKVIRQFCLHCMGNRADYVRECQTTDCHCYPYRMGKNPNRTGRGRNASEMAIMREKKGALSKGFGAQNQLSPHG